MQPLRQKIEKKYFQKQKLSMFMFLWRLQPLSFYNLLFLGYFSFKYCGLGPISDIHTFSYMRLLWRNFFQPTILKNAMQPSPFRRFSTRVWQNARANTVKLAMVCDMYFSFFYDLIIMLKGLCAYTFIFKTIVFILNLLTCSNIYNF